MSAARHAIDEIVKIPAGELGEGYSLCARMSARVYREGDEYVASLEDFPINAFGRTHDEAIGRLKREIVEHLRWLEDAGNKVTPRLARERDQLRVVVRRTCG